MRYWLLKVGSLGYLVTMTRPDLACPYSELSKYVQFAGIARMEAAPRHFMQGRNFSRP